MGHYCKICGRTRPNEKFSGKGHGIHVCQECSRELKAEARRKRKEEEEQNAPLSEAAKEALKQKWNFPRYFRPNTFGWRGSSKAVQRINEAVTEIKKAARKHPVAAGEGIVQFCERLWPTLEHVDSSSGALGTAVYRAFEALIPILAEAPAEEALRQMWLERLYEAVQEDGVGYLEPLPEHWPSICGSSKLINHWADRTIGVTRLAWSDRETFGFFPGWEICLSCLLENERYGELFEVLSFRRRRVWPYECYWAQALVKQGRIDEAIDYAESMIKDDGYAYMHSISRFCEQALIDAGRSEEAYTRYGLSGFTDTSYINRFRAIKKKYPDKDPRQILLDLIQRSENKGDWFASARQSGYLDIALDCVRYGEVDLRTLMRAAKDTLQKDPQFAQVISLRALELMLQGYGYDITGLDVREAFEKYITAAKFREDLPLAVESLRRLLDDNSISGQDNVRRILQNLVQELCA